MYTIPFADGTVTFALPDGMRGTILEPPGLPPLESWRVIRDAIRAPLDSPPLAALAGPGDRVCIVVTDATRACPDRLLVPPLVTTLELAGVAKEDITLLVATGARRASTPAEKEEKLGTDLVQRYKVLDHDSSDAAWLSDLGQAGDCPLAISRRVTGATLVLATDLVAPDRVAGFSGGATAVALGCAATATVDCCDRWPLPGSGHPAQRVAERPELTTLLAAVAQRIRLRFVVNVILDRSGGVGAVEAGDPAAVRARLVPSAREAYRVAVPEPFDIAVVGTGWPHDLNLYELLGVLLLVQAGSVPLVRPGGYLIFPAPLPEGVGHDPVACRWHAALRAAREGTVAPSEGGPAGAGVVAALLQQYRIIVAGASDGEALAAVGITPARSIDDALALARTWCGDTARVAVVPRAPYTIPGETVDRGFR